MSGTSFGMFASDDGIFSVSRIIIISRPGRGCHLHRRSLDDASINKFRVRGLNAHSLHRLSDCVPGFMVPGCNDHLSDTVCVHNVNDEIGDPTMNVCLSNVPIVDGSTFGLRRCRASHVSILHNPRTALCNRGARNKLIHVCSHGPFRCRNASLGLDCNSQCCHGMRLTRCRHVGSRLTFAMTTFGSTRGKFFEGAGANGETSGCSRTKKGVMLGTGLGEK